VLTSLLVCSDAQAAQVLSLILHELGIRVETCGDLKLAAVRLEEQPFDGLLIDCHDEAAAVELINHTRRTVANQGTVIIAIANAGSQVRPVLACGVSFVLYKPVSRDRAAPSLKAARTLMRREKRRQPRVPVKAPASVAFAATENAPATLVDLTESGAALQSDEKLPVDGKVYFQFSLPGSSAPIRLSGEVMWQDAAGRVGIRFAQVPQVSQKALKTWLQSHLPAPEEAKTTKEDDAPGGLGLTSVSAADRRVQTRHACRLGAEVYAQGNSAPQRCNLSDIGPEGCYVETTEPLPSGTAVEIVVRTQYLKLRVEGKVKSTHRGYGMGVQFLLRTAEQRQQVNQLIACEAVDAETTVEPS